MEMTVWILFCLFASVGLVQCGIWLFDAFRGPGRVLGGYHILPLYDNAEELEATVRLGVARVRRSEIPGEIMLLVDMGLGEECREICGKLIQELYGVYICAKEDLVETIEQLDNLQNAADDVE